MLYVNMLYVRTKANWEYKYKYKAAKLCVVSRCINSGILDLRFSTGALILYTYARLLVYIMTLGVIIVNSYNLKTDADPDFRNRGEGGGIVAVKIVKVLEIFA